MSEDDRRIYNLYPEEVWPILDRFEKGWGVSLDIGAGWFDIVIDLDQRLAAIDPDYKLQQVKEKFGGLRYYFSARSEFYEIMEGIVREAEDACSITCETCGTRDNVGMNINGWTRVECESCRNERETRRKK